MTLDQIKANWTDTDRIIFKTPEIKLKSLEAGKYTINVEESDCSQIVFYFDDLQPNT